MSQPALDQLIQQHLPAAAGGCTRSYEHIVGACQNTVTAIALAITRDVGASEDIAQEAFLKAWQQLTQLNNASSFLPWLRQITRNLARDWLRSNRHRPLTGEGAEIAIGMAADPSLHGADVLARLEEERVAEEVISALPEDSRETLLLFYREGQSSQHVATLLGLSDAAVRKRLSRARASVRAEMLHRFGEFARSSAPGSAFAAGISSALMLAAPGTASALALGSLTGAGKLGAGSGATTVSGGVAGGSLGALISTAMENVQHSGAALAGMAVGMLAAWAGSMYLLRYAETAQERVRIGRFVRLHNLVSAAFCIAAALVIVFRVNLPIGLLVMAVGMSALNYLYLVTLPRVMAPMLARDAARHGRNGPSWMYRSLFGRTATVIATTVTVALVAYVVTR